MKIDELSSVLKAVGVDLDKIIDDAIVELSPKWVLYNPEDDTYLWYSVGPEYPPELKRIGWGNFEGSSPIDDELMNLLFAIVDGKKLDKATWSDVAGDLVGALIGSNVYAVPVVDKVADFTRSDALIDSDEKYGYR